MSKVITANSGENITVDDWFYKTYGNLSWYLHGGYARRTSRKSVKNRKVKIVVMHRLIMWNPDTKMLVTDHINGNKLDNRMENLRLVNSMQNCQNKKPSGKSSKYKGVRLMKQRKKPWRAQAMLDGKVIFRENFKTEKEAALAYDKVASKYFGEYAYLNFPNSTQEENHPPKFIK